MTEILLSTCMSTMNSSILLKDGRNTNSRHNPCLMVYSENISKLQRTKLGETKNMASKRLEHTISGLPSIIIEVVLRMRHVLKCGLSCIVQSVSGSEGVGADIYLARVAISFSKWISIGISAISGICGMKQGILANDYQGHWQAFLAPFPYSLFQSYFHFLMKV